MPFHYLNGFSLCRSGSCHNRVAYDSKATKMYLFNPDHRRIGSKEQKQRKEQNSFSPSNSAGSDENSPCTVAAASSIVHNSELHRCSHSSLRDVREREDPVARSRYSTHVNCIVAKNIAAAQDNIHFILVSYCFNVITIGFQRRSTLSGCIYTQHPRTPFQRWHTHRKTL